MRATISIASQSRETLRQSKLYLIYKLHFSIKNHQKQLLNFMRSVQNVSSCLEYQHVALI